MNERITRVPSETDGEAEVKSDVHGWELSEKGGVVMDDDVIGGDGDETEAGGFDNDNDNLFI